MAPLPQALPAGSSTTPILVEDKERAADSMPPPPARKEIVLALRAPSAVPVAQPKSRKRKLAKSGDGETSQQGGSSLVLGLRRKVCFSLEFLIVLRTFFLELSLKKSFLFAVHVLDRRDDQ